MFDLLNGPILPCCGTLALIAVIFGFVAFMRYMSYRETLALAEKGLVHPERMRQNGGKGILRWGIIITALGLALCVGLYPLGWLFESGPGNMSFPLGFGPWMLFGLVPTFFGLALILIYVLTRNGKPKEPPKEEPPNMA